MQIYSRHSRRRVRYVLRCLQGTMTREDWAALFLAVSILLALVMWPAAAGAEEPTGGTIPGGTIPPVTGIHWPDAFVYLPYVERAPRATS